MKMQAGGPPVLLPSSELIKRCGVFDSSPRTWTCRRGWEGLIEEGGAVPGPGSIEQHQAKRVYKGAWAVVPIDPSKLPVKANRVNTTMPERVLDAVDRLPMIQTKHVRVYIIVRAVVTAYV